MTEDFDVLFEATCEARKSLEDERPINAINGACHKNVLYLADYLQNKTKFTPYIRWGAVDYYNKQYDSREDAEEDGAIHFWVEVELADGWVIADVFSMRSDEDRIKRGEGVVAFDLDSYVTFPDTLYPYTPEISPIHLLGPEMAELQNIVEPIK